MSLIDRKLLFENTVGRQNHSSVISLEDHLLIRKFEPEYSWFEN